MLENSIEGIGLVLARLEEQMKINEQFIEKHRERTLESKARDQKIINDPKSLPIEKLRALIIENMEADERVQLQRNQGNLLLNSMFVNTVQIFQNEVAYQLNLLNAKILLQTPKGEQSEKYIEIEKELQRMKHIMDEEWKPLMDSLRNEIDRRNRFLNENR